MPRAESYVGIGTREQLSLTSEVPARLPTHYPYHQLLHPHVQRRCQGDEGA